MTQCVVEVSLSTEDDHILLEEDDVSLSMLPVLVEEESVTDVSQVEYMVIKNGSDRGREKLFDSLGYSYTVKIKLKDCIKWRCSMRRKGVAACPVVVRQIGKVFFRNDREHTHFPDPSRDSLRDDKSKSKKKANSRQEKTKRYSNGLKTDKQGDENSCGNRIGSRRPKATDLEQYQKYMLEEAQSRIEADPSKLGVLASEESVDSCDTSEASVVLQPEEITTLLGDAAMARNNAVDVGEIGKTIILTETERSAMPSTVGSPSEATNIAVQTIQIQSVDQITCLSSPTQVTYKLLKKCSARGRDKLFDSLGYSYTYKMSGDYYTVWRCAERKSGVVACPAKVKQCGKVFIRNDRDHAHEPNPGQDVVTLAVQKTKHLAKKYPYKSVGSIAKEILNESLLSCPTPPKIDHLIRRVNKYKKSLLPRDPTTVDFEWDQFAFPVNFLRSDVRLETSRHSIFATEAQLEILRDSKEWHIETALKFPRQPFNYIFSIDAFVEHEKQVQRLPVAICIMSNSTKEDYIAVFNAIRSLTDERQLERLVSNYNPVLWKAVLEVMPDVVLKGSVSGFRHAVLRHAEMHCSKQNIMTHPHIRQAMALCMIPCDFIPLFFASIERKANNDGFYPFTNYLRRTWIENDMWKPSTWCVYGLPIHSGNNVVRFWCKELKTHLRNNMSLYTLVQWFHSISIHDRNSLKILSDLKLCKYQKRNFPDLQGKIFKFWRKYAEGKYSVKKLLSSCADVYGTTV